jgi:hypothetical protein
VCVCVCVCVQNALVEQGSVDEELAFRSILYYNVLLEYFCTIKASKLNRVRLACIEAASGCCQLCCFQEPRKNGQQGDFGNGHRPEHEEVEQDIPPYSQPVTRCTSETCVGSG